MSTPTPEQRAIIEYPAAPLRVAAGAGTGKTTTMAWRLAHLVADQGIEPESALGITFTNKAAQELGDQIRSRLPDHAREGRTVEVTTYHGFAYGILREWGVLVGVERNAPLITPGYARQLLRDALGAGSGYAELDVTHAPSRVDELATLAAQLGDHLLSPAAIGPAGAAGSVAERRRAELAAVLERYQEAKRSIGAVDYADLIRLAHQLLADHPDVAGRIRSRYRVVLLDEYQDTNPAQRELLLRVFGDGFPVTAVGDTDQTIYEWRGASLENFEAFPDHFAAAGGEPARTLPLTVNWRSDHAIIGLANRVRLHIGGEHPAWPLQARSDAGSGTIAYGWFDTAKDEARRIAEEVVHLHQEEGRAWRDMAILFRKNAHIGLVRDALELADVPVEVAALGGLLGVPEVNDLHAWLKLLGRPDDAAALARLLVRGRFRLGLGDLAPLAAWVRSRPGPVFEDQPLGWTLLDAAYHADECEGLRPEAARRIGAFVKAYRGLLQVAQGVSLVELSRRILDRTGAWQDVEAMDDAARLSARLNLYRFLDLAEEWSPLEGRPSLDAFLDYLDLLQEDRATDELDTARLGGGDAVALLTVHRAKGLEWPVVFLPALARGTFPAASRRHDDPDRHAQLLPYELRLDAARLAGVPEAGKERTAALGDLHRDQEWRTAYVAVTRARQRLYGTGAFWYTEVQPRERSDLLEEFAATPRVEVLLDVSEPGPPPATLRLEMLTEGAPDPLFAAGWQAALRATLADPAWPDRHARNRGAGDAYHGRVEQLRLILDGLPEAVAPEPEQAGLRTSVTGLVTYATCPLRFRWSEVDRLPRRPSPAARRGVEVHRRIELHNRGAVAIEEVDDDFYDVPGEAGADWVGDAYEAFLSSRFAAARPRLVEAPFDLLVGEARVRGRIDAVYEDDAGRWELVDFKSGRPRDKPALRVQLQAYALAVRDAGFAAEPPEHLAVTFAYLGDGLTEVSEVVDEPWLTEARARIADLVAGAEASRFPATPSSACRSCDFLHLCPAGRAWVEAQP